MRFSNGLTRYRYAGRYGLITIAAADHDAALREAALSLSSETPVIGKLEMWDGAKFVAIDRAREKA